MVFVLFTGRPAAAMPPLRLGARVGWGKTDREREEAVSVGGSTRTPGSRSTTVETSLGDGLQLGTRL